MNDTATSVNDLKVELDTALQKVEAANAQYEKKCIENEMMRKMATIGGFYQVYIDEIKTQKHKYNVDAFNKINDTYCDLFGEYRYSSHDSFIKSIRRYFKKK
ncbi:MAG: hypothetical protein BM557_09590 [Flavobacterium sp. MedPE-SWcel]|uniref:hypothetical protein n=1 Tax=uncultured Flavobacterium sp. TaxID=165435 RepID=UPI00091F4402|nr:hypothetical protein [uncultured Flavobacterium sp.]OIQ16556.1 MAG: hypothetical protein BM557_09590 [Flavobacterium sp. MedPE-SWcel]